MKIRRWVLTFLLVFLITTAFTQSMGFSESLFDSMSNSLEQDIGRSNYECTIKEKPVIQLPKAEADHLNELFERVASKCGRSKVFKFNLTVLKDDSINAFALPGGYIFVNTGLLAFARNDSELAGVLGHEIAHVDRRHGMTALYRTVGFSVLLGLILGGNDNAKRKEQIAQIAAVSLNLAQLGYSREAEYEADREGVLLMRQAGYNKQDLVNFWNRMLNKYGDTSSSLAFLSTHPPTNQRIKRIEAL